MKVIQLCPTFCDPMAYTVHGILQARILECVAFPFSRGSSWLRNQTGVSCMAGRFFTNWAIRKPNKCLVFLTLKKEKGNYVALPSSVSEVSYSQRHHLKNPIFLFLFFFPRNMLSTLPSKNMGFPCGSAGKESACNAGDLGSIPGLGRSPGEGKGYALQHSGLEISRDCTVYGVTKSRTRLSDFHFHYVYR